MHSENLAYEEFPTLLYYLQFSLLLYCNYPQSLSLPLAHSGPHRLQYTTRVRAPLQGCVCLFPTSVSLMPISISFPLCTHLSDLSLIWICLLSETVGESSLLLSSRHADLSQPALCGVSAWHLQDDWRTAALNCFLWLDASLAKERFFLWVLREETMFCHNYAGPHPVWSTPGISAFIWSETTWSEITPCHNVLLQLYLTFPKRKKTQP